MISGSPWRRLPIVGREVEAEKGTPGSPGCVTSELPPSSGSSTGRRKARGDPHDLWMGEAESSDSGPSSGCGLKFLSVARVREG